MTALSVNIKKLMQSAKSTTLLWKSMADSLEKEIDSDNCILVCSYLISDHCTSIELLLERIEELLIHGIEDDSACECPLNLEE
jgi:hypothetical protein